MSVLVVSMILTNAGAVTWTRPVTTGAAKEGGLSSA
jgi:hypothetical protein